MTMNPQVLLKLARDYAGNPMMVAAMVSKFIAEYLDDHNVDRELFCRMVRDQPRKPIDIRGENGV